MRRLLTEWDVEAENYFRLFVESFGRDRLQPHIDILKKYIDNFDYGKALELLDDMTEVAARRIK